MPAVVQHHAGQKFGRWTVIGRSSSSGKVFWDCICGCGTRAALRGDSIRRGNSTQCKACTKNNLVHGGRHRPEYAIRNAMVARCYNPNNEAYKNYGGRGITVCDRWRFGEGGLTGFECFIADMGPRPSPKLTIERRENNGPYTKENCCWDTRLAQARNRRPPARR